MSRNTALGIGLCLGISALCLACGLALALPGAWLFTQAGQAALAPESPPAPGDQGQSAPTQASPSTATPPIGVAPAATMTPDASVRDSQAVSPADQAARLAEVTMQPRDLRRLAQMLQGGLDIPAMVAAQPADYPVGTVLNFNASNEDNAQSPDFVVSARLSYRTQNVYFFAQEGLRLDQSALRRIVDEFQNRTYPTNRQFFGSEWLPGVDGDPRLYILYAGGLGSSIGGYYSPLDEYSRLAHPYSNEKEMFYINADNTSLAGNGLAATLAHEFQHMIGWHEDRDEDIWFNEGASMLAEQLNGMPPSDYAADFTAQPETQLNAWTDGDTLPHYGAAYLFLAYFLNRFGESATRTMVNSPLNGLAAVDAALREAKITNPATGSPMTTEDLIADWVAANGLNNPGLADGRFGYADLPTVPTAAPADTLSDCPMPERSETVSQFGTQYFVVDCPGTFALTFQGAEAVPVLPADPHSGRWAFWSNRGDESVSTLTRAYDLTGLSTARLEYSAWWDIEKDYDYAYVVASTDEGQTWTILRARGMTDSNPQGANFGWAYTGQSKGWQSEQVDLSAYAGRTVWIRFLYVTDAGLNANGFLLDDVGVPELGDRCDFEGGDCGWKAEGFARIAGLLPQKFVVQILRPGGGQPPVERMPLDTANAGTLPLTIRPGETVLLAVTGLTRYTTQPAHYAFALAQP